MLDVGVHIDDRELQDLLRDSKRDMKKAMRLGFGRAMTETKRKTQQYLKAALAPQRIATSLDHEIETDSQGNVTSLFGSRGPNLDGAIGVGIHTAPDDDENQYQLWCGFRRKAEPKEQSIGNLQRHRHEVVKLVVQVRKVHGCLPKNSHSSDSLDYNT